MTTETQKDISAVPETDLDWKNRRLCSDDSCIGTIGSDGRCRVCGLPDAKSLSDSHRSSDSSAVQIETQEKEEEKKKAPSAENQAPESEDPGWEDRKLCTDESCIGTIGSDGRCTVCGLAG